MTFNFIDTNLVKKKFFKVETNVFNKPKPDYMVRAVDIRFAKGLSRRDARDLSAFLNDRMRVALSEWNEIKEFENE